MAVEHYSAKDAAENQQSYYNVIRKSGFATCPFWKSLTTTVPFKGNPDTGHKWQFRPQPTAGKSNVYAEGSKRAVVTKWPTTELTNHLQIFKQTSGITGSQKEAMTIEDQKSKISDQKDLNRKQIRLDVELALATEAAPTVGTDADGNRKNTMAGAKHFAGLVINGSGTEEFDVKKHISDPMKHMWKSGVHEEKIIMCGVEIKDIINGALDGQKQVSNGEKKLVRNVTHMEDTGWDRNTPIIPNMNLADDEIIIYAPKLINPVLLRAIKDRECSDREYDAEAYEDLFELTLQVTDPNALVHIKDIKIA